MGFNEYPYRNLTDLNLDYILKTWKSFHDDIESLKAWRDEHEQEYQELEQAVENLESGNWTPEFVETLINWYKDNILQIIGEMAKTVHFGLTNDGYFCAWIPDAYSFLTFDTISDSDDPLYGHLVLMYD